VTKNYLKNKNITYQKMGEMQGKIEGLANEDNPASPMKRGEEVESPTSGKRQAEM
jgi:hypothetical protein